MLFDDTNGGMTITPTDIDGIIDYQGKLWIIVEAKHSLSPIANPRFSGGFPYGQCLALERLAKDLSKPTAVFVVRHSTPPDREIPMANTIVDWYLLNRGASKAKWLKPNTNLTLYQASVQWIDFVTEAMAQNPSTTNVQGVGED